MRKRTNSILKDYLPKEIHRILPEEDYMYLYSYSDKLVKIKDDKLITKALTSLYDGNISDPKARNTALKFALAVRKIPTIGSIRGLAAATCIKYANFEIMTQEDFKDCHRDVRNNTSFIHPAIVQDIKEFPQGNWKIDPEHQDQMRNYLNKVNSKSRGIAPVFEKMMKPLKNIMKKALGKTGPDEFSVS